MSFDITALNAFRNASLDGADAIANIGANGEIEQKNTYHGAIGALFRSKPTKAANNAVRTELLRSLGKAFGLSGMTERDGKVSFSEDFMDRLARILGPAFKRSDFGIGEDGTVKSGKPLTARRIRAIVTRAEAAAAKAATEEAAGATEETGETASASGATGATRPSRMGGVRKESVYGPYAEKLATIQKEVAKADEHVVRFFNRVAKTLDFLYEELDVARSAENAPDPSALRLDQEFEFRRELGEVDEDEPGQFEYYDAKAGRFVPLKSTNDFQSKVLWDKLGGGLLHIERAKFRLGESQDIAPLKKYIIDNARLFVMKAIDTYLASKGAGKLDVFFDYLKSPGACIEQQCMNMIAFEENHLTGGEALSAEERTKLERIANGEPAHAELPENIHETITDLLSGKEFAEMVESKDAWDDELANALKAKLLGKTATITEYDTSIHKFRPLLVDGKPVVRPLTAADIDTYGALLFKELFM